MHPVLKRILTQGGLTAILLAIVGVLFGQMAGMWATANLGQPDSPEADAIAESIRVNVPLMMAFWGFVFVVVWELVRWRLSLRKPVVTTAAPQPDETEKLLNELLARAEAARAAEGQRAENGDQRREDGQKVADRKTE